MTIKTLEELNLEFFTEETAAARSPEIDEDPPKTIEEAPPKIIEFPREDKPAEKSSGKRKRSALPVTAGILVCLMIFAALFTALTVFKYSFFTVTTASMQPVIPKGALILVHETEPQELAVGDSITFMRDWRTSVTHMIADIYEDYQSSGKRGFVTQGINNENPDNNVLLEENIVGKVVLTIPAIGAGLYYLVENPYIILIVLGALILIALIIRMSWRKDDPAKRDNKVNGGGKL